MPQFETTFYVNQIFWVLLSFGVLYLIVYYVIYPMISDVLSERRRVVDDYLTQAEQLNKQAEQNEKIYEKFLLKAQEESSEISFKTQEKIVAFRKKKDLFYQESTRKSFEKAEENLAKEQTALLKKKASPLQKLAVQLANRLLEESK